MKNRTKILIASLALLTLVTTISFKIYEGSEKEKTIMNVIVRILDYNHFEDIDINDEYSKDVYKMYLENIDFGKRFLLKSDIKKLQKYETRIDDEINNLTFEFFELSVEIIEQRMDEAGDYYHEILEKPFDFTKKETIEIDPEKRDYPKNEKEAKDQWRKYLKYNVLQKYTTAIKQQEDAKERNDTTFEYKDYKELEAQARKEVMKTYDDWFERMKQLDRDDHFASYMNAITAVFGPHTEYYPPKAKEDFDISMSGKLEGIGATLQQKEGYIKVVEIVPGSPCWKQGDLEVGDKILKVAQGEELPINIVGMRLDKAVRFIRGKKGTEVRLTVEKADGSIVIIPIIRDVVVIGETYAKSTIVTDKDSTIKIGLIYLPKFYADFNNKNGRRCAIDVAKEVEKLNHEGVDGIILDLRNNGGGSLQDVVEMSGLFIEKGPIVQVKARKSAKRVFKDDDPKLQYDGRLLVMVNIFSASASEILAAAMQDYERAIIFGGKTTHGKGTVQQFSDIDNLVRDKSIKPLGVVKLTTQKFYRINGGTTQLEGVTPDIVFKDNYHYIETGEKDLEHALGWDEISVANYEKWTPKYDRKTVISNSLQRMENDTLFEILDQNAQRMKKQRDQTEYSLNLEEYQAMLKERRKSAERYNNLKNYKSDLNFYLLEDDKVAMKTDTIQKASYESWQKNLKKDKYLKEAVNIMKDMQ